jgi:hypothetical protein
MLSPDGKLRRQSCPAILEYFSCNASSGEKECSDMGETVTKLERTMSAVGMWRAMKNRVIYNLQMHSRAGFSISPFNE